MVLEGKVKKQCFAFQTWQHYGVRVQKTLLHNQQPRTILMGNKNVHMYDLSMQSKLPTSNDESFSHATCTHLLTSI